jgi:uncharacterized protein YfaS (alpha-2-macroglobulin family)
MTEEPLCAALGFKNRAEYDAFLRRAIGSVFDKQNNTGGFGWFSSEYVDPNMSAYATWGMGKLASLISESDGFVPYRYRNARSYLCATLPKMDKSPDLQSWMLFALLDSPPSKRGEPDDIEKVTTTVFQQLYEKRKQLGNASLAMLTMSAKILDDGATLDAEVQMNTLADLLASRAKLAKEPGTELSTACWTTMREWWYFYWYDNPAESTAWALMALNRVRPESPLVEPAVNWLARERVSGRWESTRVTCIALVALEELSRTRETIGNAELEVLVNGRSLKTLHVAADKLATQSLHLDVPADVLKNGTNKVTFRSKGEATVYGSASLSYFDKQANMQPTQSGIKVERRYYRITQTPTLAAGPILHYTPMKEGECVAAGERVEVRVVVTTATTLDYLMLADSKPAGFEFFEVNSGIGDPAQELAASATMDNPEYTDKFAWLFVQPRDRTRAAFIGELPQGRWIIRYQIRAETPGIFHALPVSVEAMYSPATRGTSMNTVIGITR